ncbi:MAG TPA: hypothetical protein VFB21_01165 [Chthonomonadaceae bacterium]|nr:hypothetical protein [Chthonomonadaceae bacterium]
MEDKKGFDPVEAIVILIGVLIVGGSILLGVLLSMRPGGGL